MLQGMSKSAKFHRTKVMKQKMDSNNIADDDEKESFVMRLIGLIHNNYNDQLFDCINEKGHSTKRYQKIITSY